METKTKTTVFAQVFHVKDVIGKSGIGLLGEISWGETEIDFPANYELVADLKIEADAKDVPTGVLEQAFRLTNNIDSSWIGNEGVTPINPLVSTFGIHGRRSTSVGDIVTVAGIAYVCAPMGWTEVVSRDQKIVRGAL